MKNKEKVYDEQIAPLMSQIIKVCKDNDIPVFAEFQYSEDGFCKTSIPTKEPHVYFNVAEALSQCKQDAGINIDKFFIWVSREFPNKSSMVMHLLGNKVVTN